MFDGKSRCLCYQPLFCMTYMQAVETHVEDCCIRCKILLIYSHKVNVLNTQEQEHIYYGNTYTYTHTFLKRKERLRMFLDSNKIKCLISRKHTRTVYPKRRNIINNLLQYCIFFIYNSNKILTYKFFISIANLTLWEGLVFGSHGVKNNMSIITLSKYDGFTSKNRQVFFFSKEYK